jgi:hypothetical protein
MPRYASQNLAAIDPEYRKANGIGSGGGGDPTKRRYAYGKQNNVLVAQGAELFANGFTIRLLPVYDETAKDAAGNRQFVNFREGRDDAAFGDWGRLYTCANWVGNPGVCFIIHDGNPDVNMYDSPYYVLRNAAYKNQDTPVIGRLFAELLSKNFVPKSHVGSLRKPEKTLFVSASAVGLNEMGQPTLMAFGDDQKKNARIIGLKTSAAQSLYSALAVRDENTGEYLSGDMLSFGPGKLITFLPEGFTNGHSAKNSPALSAQGQTGVQVPKYAQQVSPVIVGSCATPSAMTHRVVVHDAYNGHPVSLEPYAEQIVAETLSWDEYMFVPTYEEQAEMLSRAFPKEALQFSWQEYPQYLRTLPRGTTTVEIGDRGVEDLEEAEVVVAPRAARPQQPYSPPVNQPSRPTGVPQAQAQAQNVTAAMDVPFDVPGDLSDDEAAGVDNMFAAATDSAPPAAPAASPRPATNVADIVAKARAAAAARGR